jgi:hypothetical protein
VRAVFYDIDGTIKPAAEPHVPLANADAIENMQRMGIRVRRLEELFFLLVRFGLVCVLLLVCLPFVFRFASS